MIGDRETCLEKLLEEMTKRAERAEKCIAEIEEALKFGRVSAAMLQICEWRWWRGWNENL